MFSPRIIAPVVLAAAVVLSLGAVRTATPAHAGRKSDVIAGSTVCGDSDGNRIVNSIDVAITLQYSAGLLDQLLFFENDDVNSDHRVDALDSQLILQVSAHRIHIELLNCS